MDGAARRAMFAAYAPGSIALIVIYVGLTALRDFRDNFAVEIWNGLGFKNNAEIFTLSELPVAAIVLAMLALLDVHPRQPPRLPGQPRPGGGGPGRCRPVARWRSRPI